MLNIFYGRENLDKDKFIFDHLDKSKRALLIVPDQFTLDFERDLFHELKADALMNIEVVSMSRLGYKLLNELGGSKRQFIDQYGRHMILAETAINKAQDLSVFRGLEEKSSFISSVNDIISELKQYNASADVLKEVADQIEGESYLKMKLSDLYLLFSEYEKKIAGKYTDSEDYIELFLGKISKSKLIKDNEIWVYGFDSFAPKALSILSELMVYAKNVNVVLTYSDEKSKDSDLFSLTGKVIENLEDIAKNRGISVKKEGVPLTYELKKSAGISHLEKELYSMPWKKADSAEGIKLIKAANIYNEAETAASYVLSLVRDKGLKYRDIRVITNDNETRAPILKRIFKEYGMDLFSDESRSITDHPIVQFLLSTMEIITEKYRTDLIFKMLKSGLADLTTDEVIDLENYAIKYRIKGSMWKKDFQKGEKEFGTLEFERLNGLRIRALEKQAIFESIAKGSKTNLEFIDSFYKYLFDDVKLTEKINDLIAYEEAQERSDLADETEQVWESVLQILDQMREIVGDEKFSLKQFKELFAIGLSQVKIGMLPPTKDGLIMGNIERTRMENVKAVVVVGANEGILPMEEVTTGVFASEEKDLFEERGMKLFKTDKIRLMEERLAIYRNLSKPLEYLYVSYSMSDAEGKPARPSSVFNKLVDVFGENALEKDILNRADPSDLINPSTAGLRHLEEALNDTSDGEKMDEKWLEVMDWYKENSPEKLEAIKAGLGFTNSTEKVGEKLTESLFKKDIASALSLSASRLEKFSRCPFSHFVSYGLNPDERRVFEVAPREIGDIYHECLMRMTREFTKEGQALNDPDSAWMKITKPELKNFVKETVTQNIKDYNEGIFDLGNEEKYRASRIIDICEKVCWSVIEQVRQGEIISSKFEEEFGRKRAIKPIEITTDSGEKVFIEGKIDRVDILRGDKVKIIDYKTGNEKFSVSEAKAGYRLQLMLYLRAAKEEKRLPAGVFYFHIQEPMIDVSGKDADKEKLEQEIKKTYKLNGLIVNDPETIKSVSGDFAGRSDILPIRITKDGEVTGSPDSLLSMEDFTKLENEVADKVSEIVENLVSGDISIYPMKAKDRSACAYCGYKGICRFDTIFEGNKYNVIKYDN